MYHVLFGTMGHHGVPARERAGPGPDRVGLKCYLAWGGTRVVGWGGGAGAGDGGAAGGGAGGGGVGGARAGDGPPQALALARGGS